jgi:hypothetical protein
MKSKKLAFILSSVAVTCFGAMISASSFAQSGKSNDGSDAKLTEQSTQRLPIRLPANKDLPRNVFRSKESFMKEIPTGAAMSGFEMTSYKDYVNRYIPGSIGATDVSPDRMVAVVVVDYPKGFVGEHGIYASARITAVRDALTGQVIAYELVPGKTIKYTGPNIAGPDDK